MKYTMHYFEGTPIESCHVGVQQPSFWRLQQESPDGVQKLQQDLFTEAIGDTHEVVRTQAAQRVKSSRGQTKERAKVPQPQEVNLAWEGCNDYQKQNSNQCDWNINCCSATNLALHSAWNLQKIRRQRVERGRRSAHQRGDHRQNQERHCIFWPENMLRVDGVCHQFVSKII